MRRDPQFPDVPTDVISVLAGDVANLKAWADSLKRHSQMYRFDIDYDLAKLFEDTAGDVINSLAGIWCSGRCGGFAVHQWNDGKYCDACSRAKVEACR